MKALVTGGHGFLGSHIVDELLSRGWKTEAPTHAECDLLNPEDIAEMLARLAPDVVVHAAAAVGGIGANQAEPGRFFYENALMGIQLMEAARLYGVQKFVTIGTACMYPEFGPIPQTELDLWKGYPTKVTAPYAIAKKALLVQGQAYRAQYGMNAIFLIPTNLYGPRDDFDLETSHVVPGMIRRISEATGNVTLWGTGRPTRDFLYVTDAARGIVDALERYDRPEPMNLGSGIETSINQLARGIATLVGFDHAIRWDNTKPEGQLYRRLDTRFAQEVIGFHREVSLAEGLERTIRWWEETT